MITITDAANGYGYVLVQPEDHASIVAGEYTHALRAVLADTTVSEQIKGSCLIDDSPFGGVPVNTTYRRSLGLQLIYDNGTSDADPGLGQFRFNNASPASATMAYVDLSDRFSVDITAWLDSLDDSTTLTDRGRIRFVKLGEESTWYEFKIYGSTVTAVGYRKLTLAYVAGAGALYDGDVFGLTFTRNGDKGNNTGVFERVTSRTDLANVDVSSACALLVEGGRSGIFNIKSGTPPASDPQQAIYIVSATAGYYWERQRTANHYELPWIGADPTGTNECAAAVNAMFTLISAMGGGKLDVLGSYRVASPLSYSSTYPIIIEGHGHSRSEFLCDFTSANQDGLTVTLSEWHTSLIPEIRGIGIRAKYAGGSGWGLRLVYTTFTSNGAWKGPVIENCSIQGAESPGPATAWWNSGGIEVINAPHEQANLHPGQRQHHGQDI